MIKGLIIYEELDKIAKNLKALEVIKQYPFEVASVVSQPTYKDYCRWFASLKDGKPILNEEQYDLLREVLL